jgi:hypothetical protein
MTNNVAFEEAVECAQILQDMIKGIEEKGMYSKESTLTFLNQALLCLPHNVREAALQSAE